MMRLLNYNIFVPSQIYLTNTFTVLMKYTQHNSKIYLLPNKNLEVKYKTLLKIILPKRKLNIKVKQKDSKHFSQEHDFMISLKH